MAKKSKLDKIKDIMDDYSLRSQKYLEEETGLKVPLETIDISVVIAYYLKNATPKEKKDLQFLSEELYLMANQTLLFKEDPFFADVLKHIERDAFNLKFDAPAAVYMPKNDNEIHLVINPFRLAKLCKSYEECAAVLEHECLHVLNRHLELYDEAKNPSAQMEDIFKQEIPNMGVQELDFAVSDRFNFIYLRPDVEEWSAWANATRKDAKETDIIKSNVHPDLVLFFNEHKDLFATIGSDNKMSSPRSITWLSDEIVGAINRGQDDLVKDVDIFRIWAGQLGEDVATSLTN